MNQNQIAHLYPPLYILKRQERPLITQHQRREEITRNKVTNHGEIPSGGRIERDLTEVTSDSEPATLDEFLLPALKAPVSS
jgi:hypothetical protein